MKFYKSINHRFRRGVRGRYLMLWTAAFALTMFTSLSTFAQKSPNVLEPVWKQLPMTYDTCYVSGVNVGLVIPPKDAFFAEVGANGGVMTAAQQAYFETLRTARIEINFIEGFDEFPQAAVAMRFAADIWETELVSDVPIRIDARFGTLEPGVLASAGSINFTNIPNGVAGTNYVSSLADAVAGFDLAPGLADMSITIGNLPFNFATDGVPVDGLTDFVSVALHEIGHGLGFSGTGREAGVGLSGGSVVRLYDIFVELGDGTPILDLGFGTPAQQAAIISDDLFINSPSVLAANGGVRGKIFAPTTFNGGSTYSHWDEATFPAGDPNSLMSPQIGTAEVIQDVGAITRGLFQDIGWTLAGNRTTVPFDLRVTEVNVMNSPTLGAAETIGVTVGNFGSDDLTSFDVSYQIDGGAVVTETFTIDLPANTETKIEFVTTADLSIDGNTYEISAFAGAIPVAPEAVVTISVTNLLMVNSFPYQESFETTAGGWITDGTFGFTSWELGTPANTIINGASEGSQAWATNLDGNYFDNENSFVLAPCFDFSAFDIDPIFSFDIFYNTEAVFDGASLQYSVDGGDSWVNVGVLGDPDNWYNGNINVSSGGSTGALDFTGANGDAWNGSSEGYVRAVHQLNGLGGNPDVMLRVAFGADGASNDEGLAFDNVSIVFPDTDLQLASIDSPTTGGGLGSAEIVTVTIRNNGLLDASGFDISYQLDGGTAVTESFGGTISSGTTTEFTFSTPVDLSTVGSTFSLTATVSATGDENTSNNVATRSITNFPLVATFPYQEGFEEGAGGWSIGGLNSSWQLGTPAAAVINRASEGEQAFVTNLTGSHNLSEGSFVLSPVFDLTDVPDPVIQLDVWWEFGFLSGFPFNGAIVQASTDLGETWQTIGRNGDPDNWYQSNVDRTNFTINPTNPLAFFGSDGDAWSGNSGTGTAPGDWVTATHPLEGIGGESSVIIRVVVGTLQFGVLQNEGIGFDNVNILDASGLPAIACAEDITVNNTPGTCEANVTVTPPSILNATENTIVLNSVNGEGNPSGVFPVGTTSITWTLQEGGPNGFVKTCIQKVTVLDNEAPTLANSGEIIIAVDQGVTETVVDYELPVGIDNCGFGNLITQSTNQELSGGPVRCPSGDNSYLRVFDLQNDFEVVGDLLVNSVDIGIAGSDGVSPGFVNLYTLNGDLSFANMQLLSSTELTIPSNTSFELVNIPVGTYVPAGSVLVLELFTPAFNGAVSGIAPASNTGPATGPSFLAASVCGAPDPADLTSFGFANQWVMNIHGTDRGLTELPATLTAGLGSGSLFPLGTTTETYVSTDGAGNSATTSFNVTVSDDLGVTGFDLIDAVTDDFLSVLTDGTVIDLATVSQISVVADVNRDMVGSVLFEVNGKSRTENFFPYAAAGESGGNFKPVDIVEGINTITATPFTKKNGGGTQGISRTVTFEVINTTQAIAFNLIDDKEDVIVRQLNDTDSIDVAVLPTFDISADFNSTNIGSVIFELDGEKVQTENRAPYSAGGSPGGNFRNFREVQPGVNTLTATAYTSRNGNGIAGVPVSVTFNLMNLATITELRLINVTTNEIVGEVVDGTVIDRSVLPKFTIEAIVSTEYVGSVYFELDGRLVQRENSAPYAAAGDGGRGFKNFGDVTPGTNTLTVTPYQLAGGRGIPGIAKTVTFEVLDGVSNARKADASAASDTNGLSEEKFGKLVAYPNPTDGLVTITGIRFKEDATLVRITDMLGNIVFENEMQAGPSGIQLDVAKMGLNAGMYFVLVETVEDGIAVVRLMKE
ncbi:HYR domain-containing protein [Fulvivirga sp. M361]|uniref:HYR domain-containing protein n=1 Tax=Fulvivirga sp. M361 TaxID=2594266 RepID=UPI001179E8F0|nr:HYR domain-containing protein [Fulvivirga sp. M361]TRX51185.1 HYR domain-containing protein [Fulvivirga sp. M361]